MNPLKTGVLPHNEEFGTGEIDVIVKGHTKKPDFQTMNSMEWHHAIRSQGEGKRWPNAIQAHTLSLADTRDQSTEHRLSWTSALTPIARFKSQRKIL